MAGRSRIRCLPCRVPTVRIGAPASAGWQPDTHRGNRHARGYDSKWEKTRERIRERDEGLCQPCLKAGRTTIGMQCDHITSKAQARTMGWTTQQIEADSNLQWICTDCHLEKTARESQGIDT